MALKESEAIVLRTYPLRESDLLVTLFTRLEGKVKGVARAVRIAAAEQAAGEVQPAFHVLRPGFQVRGVMPIGGCRIARGELQIGKLPAGADIFRIRLGRIEESTPRDLAVHVTIKQV